MREGTCPRAVIYKLLSNPGESERGSASAMWVSQGWGWSGWCWGGRLQEQAPCMTTARPQGKEPGAGSRSDNNGSRVFCFPVGLALMPALYVFFSFKHCNSSQSRDYQQYYFTDKETVQSDLLKATELGLQIRARWQRCPGPRPLQRGHAAARPAPGLQGDPSCLSP